MSLWVSRIDGSRMHEVGYMDVNWGDGAAVGDTSDNVT
jgi:hypothetical protein